MGTKKEKKKFYRQNLFFWGETRRKTQSSLAFA
jgi:hypothetical protein